MEPGGEAYAGVVRRVRTENPESPMAPSTGGVWRRRSSATRSGSRNLTPWCIPRCAPATESWQRSSPQRHPDGIAVTEAAILIETGSYRDYDRLIVAVCREEQQMERAMARDHLTREEVLDRMRRQMPLEEKVKYADYVIDTSGTKETHARADPGCLRMRLAERLSIMRFRTLLLAALLVGGFVYFTANPNSTLRRSFRRFGRRCGASRASRIRPASAPTSRTTSTFIRASKDSVVYITSTVYQRDFLFRRRCRSATWAPGS